MFKKQSLKSIPLTLYYLHNYIIDLKYILQEDHNEIKHCTPLVLESLLLYYSHSQHEKNTPE
jgi:hypothetical protein